MPSQLSDLRIARTLPRPGRSVPRNERPSAPGRSKGGRPTRQAAAELDRRILDTAAALFAKQGFAATSMEQVASACGSGKDTIYRRYPSKTLLFQAVMEGLRAQIVGELDACVIGARMPIERLRRYARALLSIHLRPQMLALNRVALAEAIAFGGVRPIPIPKDPIITRLAALVEEAQADHAVTTSDDPAFVAEQLFNATSIKPLVSRMLGEERFSTAADEDAYFDQAWTLFMKGASLQGLQRPAPRSIRPVAASR